MVRKICRAFKLGREEAHSCGRLILQYLVCRHGTPMLIHGRLERTETNLMHFKWVVT